jgi:hypothetical protein
MTAAERHPVLPTGLRKRVLAASGTSNAAQTHLPGLDLAGRQPHWDPVIMSTRSRPRPLSSSRPALRRTGTPGASSQTSATSRTPSVSKHSRITGMRPSTYLGAPSPSADALTPLATSSLTTSSRASARPFIRHAASTART